MKLRSKWRLWAWVAAMSTVFLLGMFVAGPWVQAEVIEAHQPYLLVDPDVKVEGGCDYDYLTHMPVELTGRDPSEGVRFAVAEIPVDYIEYIHYPDSWSNPLNPFNPENNFAQTLNVVLRVALGIVCLSFIAYLGILWRRGKWQKLKEKMGEKE